MPYRLDEKTHKIFIDAPSVTTIVNEVYPFPIDQIPKKYLEMGQEKGTCVHKQIEMYIKYGSLIGCEHNVKTHKVQFEFLKKWWDEFKEKELSRYETKNEIIMYSKIEDWEDYELDLEKGVFELTGIADLIIEDDDFGTILIDWKTTKEEHKKKEAMQLWMYGELYNRNMIDKYMIVNSNTKHAYEITYSEIEQGKQDALKGLQMYREKKDTEIWN